MKQFAMDLVKKLLMPKTKLLMHTEDLVIGCDDGLLGESLEEKVAGCDDGLLCGSLVEEIVGGLAYSAGRLKTSGWVGCDGRLTWLAGHLLKKLFAARLTRRVA
jgi:hypothetical protein